MSFTSTLLFPSHPSASRLLGKSSKPSYRAGNGVRGVGFVFSCTIAMDFVQPLPLEAFRGGSDGETQPANACALYHHKDSDVTGPGRDRGTRNLSPLTDFKFTFVGFGAPKTNYFFCVVRRVYFASQRSALFRRVQREPARSSRAAGQVQQNTLNYQIRFELLSDSYCPPTTLGKTPGKSRAKFTCF